MSSSLLLSCPAAVDAAPSDAATEHMESEALFRATFENAAVGIAHVALDGSFLRVNARLCEITKYPAGELLTKTFQEITYPEDCETNLAV
jgi:PAS domain S-box-containing protein